MATAQIPSGFPDASNTGTADGTALTRYTGPMTVSQGGTVIENRIIDGSLVITGANVVIRNCVINSNSTWGIDAERASNVTVQDCTITGPGYGGDSNSAILGSGTFLRNDISRFENGISLTGGASTVRGNYIHDLQDSAADPHYDGISVQGGQNGVLIENNTVLGRDTSDVFIKNDFGPISNVTVNNNFLGGEPGYNLYVDGRAGGGAITGVRVTNNVVDTGFYGDFSVNNSSPLISGNVPYNGTQVSTPVTAPASGSTPAPSPAPSTSTRDVVGTSASDRLSGGAGADRIVGNAGNDLLTGGGGADTFVYNSTADSRPGFGQRDLIYDFQPGVDKIDLSKIDANELITGDQTFQFLGQGDFQSNSSSPGQLRYHYESTGNGDRTVIEATTNRTAGVDFQISLVGRQNLTAGDFNL